MVCMKNTKELLQKAYCISLKNSTEFGYNCSCAYCSLQQVIGESKTLQEVYKWAVKNNYIYQNGAMNNWTSKMSKIDCIKCVHRYICIFED